MDSTELGDVTRRRDTVGCLAGFSRLPVGLGLNIAEAPRCWSRLVRSEAADGLPVKPAWCAGGSDEGTCKALLLLEISTAIAFASCSTLRLLGTMSRLREPMDVKPLELPAAEQLGASALVSVLASVELLASAVRAFVRSSFRSFCKALSCARVRAASSSAAAVAFSAVVCSSFRRSTSVLMAASCAACSFLRASCSSKCLAVAASSSLLRFNTSS